MRDLTKAEMRIAKYLCGASKEEAVCDKHKTQGMVIIELLKDQREVEAREALDRLAASRKAA